MERKLGNVCIARYNIPCSMRNLTIGLLSIFAFLSVVFPVLASERPKGVENRGPLGKMTFIHRKRQNAKPPWAGGGGNTGNTKCYSFLSKGAKWKSIEDYVINPTNNYGLSNSFVKDNIEAAIGEWNGNSLDLIFGSSSFDTDLIYDGDTYDELNSVSFGVYPEANVIAVTTVWGYFGGKPKTRELVEWDMLLNTGSGWSWGDATSNGSLMDIQNIIAHELGHSAGLGHPENTCTDETMYAYSDVGEIIKRDLNSGDIKGIEELYK